MVYPKIISVDRKKNRGAGRKRFTLVEKHLTRPRATTNFNSGAKPISSIAPCYATLASSPPRKRLSSLASAGGGGSGSLC